MLGWTHHFTLSVDVMHLHVEPCESSFQRLARLRGTFCNRSSASASCRRAPSREGTNTFATFAKNSAGAPFPCCTSARNSWQWSATFSSTVAACSLLALSWSSHTPALQGMRSYYSVIQISYGWYLPNFPISYPHTSCWTNTFFLHELDHHLLPRVHGHLWPYYPVTCDPIIPGHLRP